MNTDKRNEIAKFNLFRKLTVKNLKLNKRRTIVTIVGIMLSVALITAAASIYASGIRSLIKYEIKETGKFHVAFYDMNSAEIKKLYDNRKIEAVSVTKNLGYAKIDSKNEYKPYVFVKGFTEEALNNLSINLVKGRLPQNENEILIPTHLMTNGRVKLEVGDKITLEVGRRVTVEGGEQKEAEKPETGTKSEIDRLEDGEKSETGDGEEAETGKEVEENPETDNSDDGNSEDKEQTENVEKNGSGLLAGLSDIFGNNKSKEYELGQDNPYSIGDDGEPMERITDTVTRTFMIVGVTERPAYSVEPYSAPGYTIINRIDEAAIDGKADAYIYFTKDGLDDIYKTTAGILGIDEKLFEALNSRDDSAMEELGGLTNEMLDAYYNILNKSVSDITMNAKLIVLEGGDFSNSALRGLTLALYIVMGIIVVTSVFCIKNSFDISITEKSRQYGMLRSVGATKRQIRKNVFSEAAVLGAFGLPLGILLGFAAAYILVGVSNYYLGNMIDLNFRLSFVFSYEAMAAAVILGIVTVFLSAWRSAVKASKVSPIEAIRNSAGIKISSKKLGCPAFIRKIFGMGGEISYKNLKRNRKKYRTTVISITVSVIVFITLSAFVKMAYVLIDSEVMKTDYNVGLSTSGLDDDTQRKIAETTRSEYVEDYSIIRENSIELENVRYNKEYVDWMGTFRDDLDMSYMTVTTVGNEQLKKYCKELGLDYEDTKDKGILFDWFKQEKYNEDGTIESRYIRMFSFEDGDIINGNLREYSGEDGSVIKEEKKDIKIAKVTNTAPFGLKGWNYPTLIVRDEMFDEIVEMTDWKKYGHINVVYKSSEADKLQDEIETLFSDVECNITNNDEEYRQMDNLVKLICIFLYGFIIVISLIGVTNIFNTITTNMELRKQEFAMLRSVGMTNREFNHMIWLESVFMGVKSLLWGIPISIILSFIIYKKMMADIGFTFTLPGAAMLMAAGAVFLLIYVIMLYSMGRIKTLNTIETIRNENI